MKNSLIAIIPSAGTGSRACKDSDHEIPKQYRNIAGKPMLIHSIMSLLADSRIKHVIVSVSPQDTWAEYILSGMSKVTIRKYGGSTRFETVRNTINSIDVFDNDWVIIHDAARPGLPISCLKFLIDKCLSSNVVGGLLAIPASNTIKRGIGHKVDHTIDRNGLWLAQTPQMFRVSLLCKALNIASDSGLFTTDESSALELIGLSPIMIRGSIYNMKVTWPEDFEIMEKLI
ncbi:2-C-methyl-D-erythritol 4-phosphate cytidylyltransferase [Candidatus Kinetoplastibacterium blastocrithidii TCC012E]|uniref:2-C-methyl-D-erythritol 4-phosphate cytidylyltransferase n=1 Tax=Candidatus Kinetoplastidibacterium blastocrithidiae TCC012E TaxID=1208922 RepID=M1LWL5_9PROT|nr:2-C-methyl-D-erythritol 4-phosphate cytidylyltransferase [Candidatus Kinetoplastibacterium blastocrithidii]AFZ83792.1 2-C-methyl-D-erythritol 4-phosphate cytidylyltransferase [Candidatus Kinetoplastibacterium blastocrithidii (ex Strigomonas culicis)]AGF49917.1 2-C-methyl-D-erythritol 4-phosphate cytidylyltransferase [Candidatus Kinetoplastibacterium blastocrithidii TCC012E]